jgi:hypothetical protein
VGLEHQRFVPPEKRLSELVRFANTGTLGPLLSTAPDVASGMLKDSDINNLCARVRSDLIAIAKHEPLTGEARERLQHAMRGMAMRPWEFDFSTRMIRLKYVGETLEAQTSFLTIVLLLPHADQEATGRLYQCQLEASGKSKACGKLFFSAYARTSQIGRIPWKFCGPDHFKEHRRRKARERAARWRRNQPTVRAKHK